MPGPPQNPGHLCAQVCSSAYTAPSPAATTPAAQCIQPQSRAGRRRVACSVASPVRTAYPPSEVVQQLNTEAPTDIEYDAVIIGSGMGGLATAAQLVARGAKVVVLEK